MHVRTGQEPKHVEEPRNSTPNPRSLSALAAIFLAFNSPTGVRHLPGAAAGHAGFPSAFVSSGPVHLAVAMADATTHEHIHKVYIEDTDCYDVVFYANYFRFCANARWAAQHSAPVVQITSAKYSRPAQLGTRLRIKSSFDSDAVTHVLCDAHSDEELWSADLRLAVPEHEAKKPAMPPLAVAGSADHVVQTEIVVYPDDVGSEGIASETDVLRWFERCRTDAIGGASGLASLKEAGVLVVVARIAKGVFDVDRLQVLGKTLLVRSVVKIMRKGAVIKFVQQLLDSSIDPQDASVIASADVTCAAISAVDGSVSALPQATIDALAQATAEAQAPSVPEATR